MTISSNATAASSRRTEYQSVLDLVDGVASNVQDDVVYELKEQLVMDLWGPRHQLLGLLYVSHARFLYERRDYRNALRLALAGEDILREHLYLDLRTLSQADAYRLARVRETALDIILSIAVRRANGRERARCWDALLRSRALVLDELVSRQRAVAGSSDPRIASVAAALVAEQQRLAEASFAAAVDADSLPRSFIPEVRQRIDALEAELGRRSASYARFRAFRRADLQAVRDAMRTGEAVVAYAYFSDLGDGAPARRSAGGAADPAARAMAFVLQANDVFPTAILLGNTEHIDALVRRWRERMARSAAGGVIARGVRVRADSLDDETQVRAIGDSLRRIVWDPVAPFVSGASRVYIVFDGALHLLTLDALPAPAGQAYLVEQAPLFSYLDAERDLVRRQEPAPDACGMLAMGIGSFGLQFPDLPHSEIEARTVHGLWETQHKAERSACRADLLTGTDATKGRFKDLCAGRNTIHLSTHAFFVDRPTTGVPPAAGGRASSALAPAGRGRARSAFAPPAQDEDDPMLRAGLVFSAGSDSTAQAFDILTAAEVGGLDLSATTTVFLSACDTGVGLVEQREGLVGLRRAFCIAGAGTVVASLWRVQDDLAAMFMRRLYAHQSDDGADPARAVRNANLDMLRVLRANRWSTSPALWAAFVATGVARGT